MQLTREFLDTEEQERQRKKHEKQLQKETITATIEDQQALFFEQLNREADRQRANERARDKLSVGR